MVSNGKSDILQQVKSLKTKKIDPKFTASLEAFFQSALGQKAAAGLSDSACVVLQIDDTEYFFLRRKGKNHLSNEAQGKPDIKFWVQESTMRHLMAVADLPGTGLGTLGVAIFEEIFHKDPSKKIKFRVEASILSLWAKGYFSVLKAGGPEVASYLARWGFDSFSKIKEILQKIRG